MQGAAAGFVQRSTCCGCGKGPQVFLLNHSPCHRFVGRLCAPLTQPREALSISPGLTAGSHTSTRPGNAKHQGGGELAPGWWGLQPGPPVPSIRRLLSPSLSSVNYRHFFFLIFFFNVYLFLRETETEHEWGRGRERERHRIRSRLQAPSCQHRARTHKLRDHDLSRSRLLN